MSMTNSNHTIGSRSPDLPVCSTVPQPLRHRVPPHSVDRNNIIFTFISPLPKNVILILIRSHSFGSAWNLQALGLKQVGKLLLLCETSEENNEFRKV
jgi:hypothetical protein